MAKTTRLRFQPALALLLAYSAFGDDVLNRYEGDVHPLDASTGWVLNTACTDPCSEFLEDGHFVQFWSVPGNHSLYTYWLSIDPDPPPPSLWAEWRFRSNLPWDGIFDGCDGLIFVRFDRMNDGVGMYGDTVISQEGGDLITGLDITEFYTYRFESADGVSYRFSVNGQTLFERAGLDKHASSNFKFGGGGGCIFDPPNIKNEWDFVRLGTLSFGEQVVSTDPPSGYLDPGVYAGLDRFTVTFDSANYVYIDDITVEVTGGTAPPAVGSAVRTVVPQAVGSAVRTVVPQVIQTRRRETDDVDTVEIVLDGPLPVGQRTRFILDDGQATNVINYCLGFGPSCGDGCCNVGEDCTTCPQDCIECGDGCCVPGEDTCNCPADCSTDCGDGCCNGTEDCTNCTTDCNTCGDGCCVSGETACTCLADCPAQCGDGCCSPGETFETCPADCEAIPAASTWGVAVLTFLILTTATVLLRRQPLLRLQ